MHQKRSLGLLCVLLALPAGTALAGHTNPVLVTELNGRESVDPDEPGRRLAGDPDGEGEAYVFGIDGDPTTLCYVLTVDDIQLVPVGSGMMAHIHEGVRDANGPVVAALAGPEDGNAADCLTEGETGKFPTAEAGIVERILANPSQFYINVHNPEFPAGAIRGQLEYQADDHDDDAGGGSTAGAPSVPTGLAAQAYSGTAGEITWQRSTDDVSVTGYEVFRNGSLDAAVPGNSYFVEGLTPATSYEFSVLAIDNEDNRSGRSNAITLTTR